MLRAWSRKPVRATGARRFANSACPPAGQVRTRFAPSPTGELHLGGLRTALFSMLWARRHGGQFILRVEDTDRTRVVEGAAERLLRELEWSGVMPDEYTDAGSVAASELPDSVVPQHADWLPGWARGCLGGPRLPGTTGSYGPYFQSQRHDLGLYRDAADAMLRAGTAYRCFCSSERLDALRGSQRSRGVPVMYDRACAGLSEAESDARARAGEPFTVRLRVPLSSLELGAQEDRWEAARAEAGAGFAAHEERLAALPAPEGCGEEGEGPGAAFRRTTVGVPSAGAAGASASSHGVLSTTVSDVALGRVSFTHSALDDAVLLKASGWPTYHLASVVDDVTMGITDVIRGQEWLPSAPKHALVYRGLGVRAPPRFTHLPLLLGPNRRKLSKRHGDASVAGLRANLGVSPEALLNFVAFLGWTPPGAAARAEAGDGDGAADRMSAQELAGGFALSDVHRSNAVVERKRLEWFYAQHRERDLSVGWAAQPADAEAGARAARELGVVVAAVDRLLDLGSWPAEQAGEVSAGPEEAEADGEEASEAEAEAEGADGEEAGGGGGEAADSLSRASMPAGWAEHHRAAAVAPLLAKSLASPMRGGLRSPIDAGAPGMSRCSLRGSATVAAEFCADYLTMAVWLQQGRAALPADVAPLVVPFLVPPDLSSAPPPGVLHPDADRLLAALQTAWESLADSAFHRGSALPRIETINVGPSALQAESADEAMACLKSVTKSYAAGLAEQAGPAEPGPKNAPGGKARKARRQGMPASRLMLPLRWVLTGQTVGPPLNVVVALLGRRACGQRIEVGRERIRELTGRH